MDEKNISQVVPLDDGQTNQPEILVNNYGTSRDPAVVVDEATRTVLLTPNETIVIEKQPELDIVPSNRPRRVYGGMWGQAEIATVGLAMLAVLTVILLYIFLVLPSNRQLDNDRTERDRLDAELTSAKSKYGNITSTENQVSKLVSSVNDFEINNLAVPAIGKNALYQRLNGLITAYGLTNTSGPDYSPLEIENQNAGPQTDEERGRAKYRSIFPGIYVTMTVEGPYQNLRRFIADVERGNDFVVISSVQLEPSDAESNKDQSAGTQAANPQLPAYSAAPIINGPNGPVNSNSRPVLNQPQFQRPKGKTHGEVVSLRLEMAAYFRRANFAPATEPAAQ
jgi:General secretion pathway protein M.